MLPGTNVNLGNGLLGKSSPSEDGTSALLLSGVAVGGQFALGDVLGPFLQPEDAEAKGINAAYDTANTTNAYKHIQDFYKEAPLGTKLYVMVVDKAQPLTTSCTLATVLGVNKLLLHANGLIKLLGLTHSPAASYIPTFADQFENDLWTAIAALKVVHAQELTLKRPFRAFIEGRNFQGAVATVKQMRALATTPAANMVSVVCGNDNAAIDGVTGAVAGKYASVGLALGKAAAGKVNRNIGRVKSGTVKVTKAGLSNGSPISAFTDAQLGALNDAGFVFMRSHVGKAGYYWSHDHMACVSTDDYSQLTLGRTIDKVISIVHRVNTEEILDELEADPVTGKLDIATVKHYQKIIETAVNAEMTANKEIVRVSCFVDPNQNVLSTGKLTEVVKIVPTGVAAEISTTLEYENPLAT